ncbi:MerR family transcriptional regulator [Dyadobacter crusticola]|uniref:MerR family transcriptional regulator n=1 Tax=Dyadobacter crusticola TaxID=292407 RepID=UPI0004E15D6B|nr:MerR family transcriptional regulator [Dyadobacter crusticola]
MLINELSKRTGVPIPTLRYYESLGFYKGLVDNTVKTNNYRCYEEDLVDKIALIREAKEVGFTLAEIKFLLESWKDNKLTIADKVNLFNAKISEVNLKIRQLEQVKDSLVKTVEDIKNGDC